MKIAQAYQPSCQFKGFSSEQEQKLEEAKESHLKQIAALAQLSGSTAEEIVNYMMTFGPDSHYGKQGGVKALQNYALPPNGYRDYWNNPVKPEDSDRCWHLLTLMRQHPKSENATQNLLRIFAESVKHKTLTHYEPSGFPEEVEKQYILTLIQCSKARTANFLVDVLEHHMGITNSQPVIKKVTEELLNQLNGATNKIEAVQQLVELISQKPSSKGIPDELFNVIQTTLYPH